MKRLLSNCINKLCGYRVYHQTKKMNISNGIVSKQYWDRAVFEIELEVLNYLNSKVEFVPKVLNVDYKNLIIRIKYCGLSLLNTGYLPYNWKQQIDYISDKMTEFGIYHNDLKLSNLTVYNNRVYLIDFGHATFDQPKRQLNCFKKSRNDFQSLIEIIQQRQINNTYCTFSTHQDNQPLINNYFV